MRPVSFLFIRSVYQAFKFKRQVAESPEIGVFVMKKVETRAVEVNYCDGCKKEAQHLEKCAVCKKEFCMEEGGKKHFSFALEIYKYTVSDRASTHV